MSEIRTNMIISGESSEYRSNIDISIVTLNNTLIDTHSSFRTNVNISTTLNDGSVSQIQTTLELNNVALQFYLVDMTKLNQSILYFSKFFNMYFEPEVMWELLAQGTNEQINTSHLSNALSKYTLLDTTVSLIKTIESVGTNLNTHKIDDNRHFTIDEKEFLLNLMENPSIIGTGGGLFEKVIINRDNTIVPAVRPIKQEGKDSGIISNTFISCKGTDITAVNLESGAGLTRYDLFSILTSDPLNTDEYINEKFLRLDKIAEEVLKGEKDPTVPVYVKSITREQIYSWDLVASLFKVSQDNTYVYLTNNRGFISNSFISCKGLDDSTSISNVIDINQVWFYLQQETSEQINKSHLSDALSEYVTTNWILNQGYLKEFIEQDPTVASYIKNITQEQINNWDLSSSFFGLSDDNTYIFTKDKRGFVSESFISCKGLDIASPDGSSLDMDLIWHYLQQDSLEQINISHIRDALYDYVTKDWINSQGFLTNFTESDPTVPSYIKTITKEQIDNWNSTLSLFSLIDDTYVIVNNNKGFVSNSFISCRGVDDTSISTGNIDMDLVWFYLQSNSNEQIHISHLREALSDYATTDWINAQGYLKNFVETDPTVPNYIKEITLDQINSWNIAASLFSISEDNSYLLVNNDRGIVSNSFLSCKGVDDTSSSTGSNIDMDLVWYFLSQKGNDQIHSSHLEDALKDYTTKDWVNAQGYLKSFVEKDPTVPSYVKSITQTQLNSWDLVASLFSLIEDSYILVNNNRGFVVNSYISCKGLDANSYQSGTSFNRNDLFDILSGNPNNGEFINNAFIDLSNYVTLSELNNKGYITSISKSDIIRALNYTPQEKITESNLLSYTLISGVPTSLKNPYSLTIIAGSTTVQYDGSTTKSITITAASLGALTEHQDISHLLSKKEAESTYQIAGDYITIQEFNSELNNRDYITAGNVSNTYATKAQLNNTNNNLLDLQDAHDTLRSEFDALDDLLNSDVSGKINTWQEVVNFLDEYSSSQDLATILSGINADIAKRALQSDLDKTNTNLSNYIKDYNSYKTATDKRLDSLESLWYLDDENSAVRTKLNLIVEEAISFGGLGTSSGGEVGITSLDIIIPNKGTFSINAGKIQLPSYPEMLPASDVYAWAKAANKPTYTKAEVGLGNVQNVAVYTRELGVNDSNWTFASTYYTENGKSTSIYAPTSAGTAGQYLVSNGAGAPYWHTINPYDSNISRTANTVLAAPNGYDGSATFRKLVSADIPSLDWSKITSGKPTTLSGYGITDAYTKTSADSTFLKLSGGVLKGTSSYVQYVLTLNTDNTAYTILALQSAGTYKGALEWTVDEWQSDKYFAGLRLRNSTTGDVLGLSDAGKPQYNKNELIHSGNYTNYVYSESEANARFFGRNVSAIDAEGTTDLNQAGYGYATGGWYGSGPALAFGSTNGYTALIQQGSNTHTLYVSYKSNGGDIQDWRALAFLDSNVASAKKLAYNSSNVGLEVNSSGNVVIQGSHFYSTVMHTSDIGTATMPFRAIYTRYLDTYSGYDLRFRTGGTEQMRLAAASGCLILGDSNASENSAYKLDVRGVVRAINSSDGSGVIIANQGNTIDGYYNGWGNLYLNYTSSGNVNLAVGGGNVGIGTTDPQYKLDVKGKIRFNAVTIWGQSFDGTGNVSGALSLNTSKLYWQLDSNNYYISCPTHSGGAMLEYKAYSGHSFLGGNVAIGTTPSTSYKLYISGSQYTNGNIVATGTITFGSDIRYKRILDNVNISLETIANAPLFNYVWSNKNEDKIHLGTSAQYWNNTTFKNAVTSTKDESIWTMSYSEIAMGGIITLAKELIPVKTEVQLLKERVDKLESILKEKNIKFE